MGSEEPGTVRREESGVRSKKGEGKRKKD